MEEREAIRALGSVGLRPRHALAIPGGCAYWTFDVDGARIARFPRNRDVAESTHRELALLPELAEKLSFAIPDPTHDGVWQGQPFFVYRRILGRPLEPDDATVEILDALGAMLGELHEFPVERAAPLLGTGDPGSAWRDHLEELWTTIESEALPAMEPDLGDRVAREYHAFLATDFNFPHCVVHNDLGLEHILINDSTSTLSGFIDFESAWIGDPAVDFVPLRADLGRAAFETVSSGRDLGERLEPRMHFYRWLGSVHAVLYGVNEGADAELVDGLAQLRERIESSPHAG